MPVLTIISKGVKYPCLYDSEDHELITRFTWSLHSQGYAVTTIKGKQILMHRLILGIVDSPEIQADHIYHNKLDNRRSKIRICSHSENRRNSRKLKPTAHSKFKGVYNDLGLWHVQIMQNSRVKNLGRYGNEKLAAKVYDQKALELFKDFAFINFKSSAEARQLTLSWI